MIYDIYDLEIIEENKEVIIYKETYSRFIDGAIKGVVTEIKYGEKAPKLCHCIYRQQLEQGEDKMSKFNLAKIIAYTIVTILYRISIWEVLIFEFGKWGFLLGLIPIVWMVYNLTGLSEDMLNGGELDE